MFSKLIKQYRKGIIDKEALNEKQLYIYFASIALYLSFD